MATTHMEQELRSQPEVWTRAIGEAKERRAVDPIAPQGTRVAVIGCGTSWFMAQAWAKAREGAGEGLADAFSASESDLELRVGDYDLLVAITRSGTTTEVLEVLAQLKGKIPTVALIGDTDTPIVTLADRIVALPYADEKSVVQTRFATTALAYLLTDSGLDLGTAVADAAAAVDAPTPQDLIDAEQFTFLGRGWTFGLANEAALKMREAVQGWTESYPAKEYRHGPIAIAGPRRVTWMLGDGPSALRGEVEVTGGTYLHHPEVHPLAELARVHKVTLDRALARGLNPDEPRHLTRSIILDGDDA
ncbi:SIS domain-containing protein [Galactobacter caseinivorans]|uniref:SIS domain-containing protein n=1 Tax=Galactobacter caseinivorans TaxID=2676123 RepID=A0A496PGH2_9MICC|nr:SIS domain-containing protein [Galactobacter caseinivorans]RKW69578.1 SIS domain-containing protein [Galactobacter caseinivorans]